MLAEPSSTAWLLATWGVLLVLGVLLSRASRTGIPVFLLFLGLGMLAGSEGLGGIVFDDYSFSFRLGTVALVLILFDGGLNTPWSSFRLGFKPAAVLATVGVLGTAAVVAVGARLLGFEWRAAFLVGAVVSSTDAAAVFSTLRASGLQLKRRVGTTLELESGLNDPVAVILTTALTYSLAGREAVTGWFVLAVLGQLAVGSVVGFVAGFVGRLVLKHLRLQAGGLFPVLTLALAFAAFGLATIAQGSGFLAVYVAGLVIGNSHFPYRSGLLRFHDATAWLSQVSMFVLLGLLVFPSQLVDVAGRGIVISLVLVFIARPLVVWLCLLPFGYPAKEIVYVGFLGLRGAVPIILATFPVLAGIGGAESFFHVVFFVVVVTALVPGGTVGWLTRRLGLASNLPPPPPAAVEITSLLPTRGEVTLFYVRPASSVYGAAIRDIPFAKGAAVLLIVRHEEIVVPNGDTVLQPDDYVYVIHQPPDLALLRLLFGSMAEED